MVADSLPADHMHLHRKAARYFEGTHDFTQFSSVSTSGCDLPGRKTLTRVEVSKVQQGFRLLFAGSGFLYNQCRHMAGCLIRIGMGGSPAAVVKDLLCRGQVGGTQ